MRVLPHQWKVREIFAKIKEEGMKVAVHLTPQLKRRHIFGDVTKLVGIILALTTIMKGNKSFSTFSGALRTGSSKIG